MKGFLLKLVASDWKHFNGAVLFLRLFAGSMMLTHGWAKLSSFAVLAERFPDPLGVGSMLSLILILCAEVGCSLLLIFGLMTRLATIPLIFGMLMAFFFIHATDPFAVKELPLMYTGIYVALLWSGGGKYAVDEIIRRNLIRRENFE
ncbi:MAG: DoxX family protein [Odoribacter sp.]|nr:DoxX family protein [Odoribacter sp.]